MNKNFLLIERNTKIIEEIKKAFSNSKHSVTIFEPKNANTETIIAELEEFCRAEKFHIVLLENDLPFVSGVDLMPVFLRMNMKVIAFAASFEGMWKLGCAGAHTEFNKDNCYTSRGFNGDILLKGLEDLLLYM